MVSSLDYANIVPKEVKNMENMKVEINWSEVNRAECDDTSLQNMCSWAEAD